MLRTILNDFLDSMDEIGLNLLCEGGSRLRAAEDS